MYGLVIVDDFSYFTWVFFLQDKSKTQGTLKRLLRRVENEFELKVKKTSYELLTGNKPNVSYFRVFGSKCYILVKKGRHSKFAPKAIEGFLLGYD
jgi:hypothetical protein